MRSYVLGRGQLVKGYKPSCEMDPTVLTTLSSIQEFDKNGAALPAQSFTYDLFRTYPDGDCNIPTARLVAVQNGYGAQTEFAYEWDGDQGTANSYRVKSAGTTGGVASAGAAISTTYAYGAACYNRWILSGDGYTWVIGPCTSRAVIAAGKDVIGPLVGHSAVTETQRGATGETLAQSVHRFHIDQNWRVGREWQAQQLDPSGTLLQQQDTQYMSSTIGNGALFTFATVVTSTQGSQVSRASYKYDVAQQGGVQYGNLTAEYHDGDLNATGDERTIRRLYYPITTPRWIVNKVARETVYTGIHTTDDDNNVTSRTCNQYDGRGYGYQPTTGALTAVNRWQGGPGSSACTNLSGYVTTGTGYDTWGNPIVITDALTHTTRTQYDSLYHLYPVVITNTLSRTMSAGYDLKFGLPLTVTDPNGASTYYRYDTFGRLIKVIRPGDSEANPTLSYAYADGPAPWKIETWQRERSGCSGCVRPVFNFYDGLGRLAQTRAETVDGSQQSVANIVYDTLGRKYREYQPALEGYSSSFSLPGGWDSRPGTTTQYDALGRTVRVVNPDGTDVTSMYAGWSASQVDANGHYKVSMTDAYGRLGRVDETVTTLEDPFTSLNGGTWSTGGSYSIENGTLRLTGPSDWNTQLYRSIFNIDGGEQGQGIKVEFKVDGSNTQTWLMLQTIDDQRFGVVAENGKIFAKYNPGGQWQSNELINPLEVNTWYVLTLKASRSYGAYVEVWRKDDPSKRGAVWIGMGPNLSYRFHAWIYQGNVWLDNYHELSYQTTSYAYDVLDHLGVVTDTLGNTTVITYNALGLKTGMRDPDMGAWSYRYDLAGNLITQTDALNRILWFKYDPLNRVTEKRQNGGTGPLLAKYWYDESGHGAGIGQRTTMTDATSSATWAYDSRGRVLTETRVITGAGTFTTSFGYDAMDRVVTMTYPTGEVITHAYNAAAQLTSVRSATYGLNYARGMTYNALGQLTALTTNNGNLTTNYTYDSLNFRLKRIQAGSLLDLSYSYDPVGNVKSITDTTNSGQVQRFSYDALDRLVSANTTSVGTGQYAETYQYNPIGNITYRRDTGNYFYPSSGPGSAQPHAVSSLSSGCPYQCDAGNRSVQMRTNDNQVGAWRFEEGGGTIAGDSTGNGRTGTLLNGVSWGVGKIGSGVSLNGTNQYVDVTSVSALKYTGGNLTLAAWIKPNSGETAGNIFSKPWNGGGQYNYRLVYQNGQIQFLLLGATAASLITGVTTPAGSWHHVVATVDANKQMKIYVDGVVQASGTHTITSWTPSSGDVNVSLVLGSLYPYGAGWGGNSGFSFAGLIDEAVIYDQALGATEVQDLYRAETLVSTWRFEEGGGTVARDGTGNGRTGTLLNGVSWGVGKIGGGVSLNGTNQFVQVASVSALKYTGGNLTLAAWIKPGSGETAGNIFSKAWNGGGQYNYRLVYQNGQIRLLLVGATEASLTTGVTAPAGSWHHVVATVDVNKQMKIFVDGVEQASGTHTISSWTPSSGDVNVSLVLGSLYPYAAGWGGDSSFSFAGLIDEAVIYDRALGTAEVQDLYNCGAPLASFVYDNNGNMLTRVEVSGTQRITYTQGWDVENRLIAVTNTVTLSVTRFYYDGDGTRTKKVESKGGTTITTAYAGAIEVTITGTQRITQAYYLAGAQRVATRVITSTGSVVYYLHADHLGSASLTTDWQGNKYGELRYSPYGVTRYVWGNTPTDRRFTGQRSEEASLGSLYDYGARMYSPYLNRWIQPDSIVPQPGNAQSLNRYAYVRNNPLRYADPTGHRECEDEDCLHPTPQRRAADPLPPHLQQSQPRPDEFDLFIDSATTVLDGLATAATTFGTGIELGGCIVGGLGGCATGFGLYTDLLNVPETLLGGVSTSLTVFADFKRHNSHIDPTHLGVTIAPDSVLAATSFAVGFLDPEPASDTLINLNSFMNDVNNLEVDRAAARGEYITPGLPVVRPAEPVHIRPLDWLIGPYSQIVYTILGGN